MRLLYLLVFLISSLTCSAQFEFKSDTTISPYIQGLASPSFDSVQFEMRLWESGALIPINYFLRLSYSDSKEWHLSLGIVDDSLFFEEPISERQDSIKKLWNDLLEFQVLTLKDQNDATVWLLKDGKRSELTSIQVDKLGPTDGSVISLELFRNNGYRTINYYEPLWYYERFNLEENWSAPDYENMVGVLNRLKIYFNSQNLRQKLLRRWAENRKK